MVHKTRITALLLALTTLACGTGCSFFSESDTASTKSESRSARLEQTEETAREADEAEEATVGYITLNAGQEAADLYASADEGAQVLVKMFAGAPITVYEIKGDWAKIAYGSMQGYVTVGNVSFTAPEESVAEETAAAETEASSKAEESSKAEASSKPQENSQGQDQTVVNIIFMTDQDGFQVAEPVSYTSYQEESTAYNAWCSAQSIYIYSQPDKNSQRREANMLYYGDSLRVLGSVGDWYYISTDSGNGYDLHGYVGQSYITYGDSPAAPENPNATQGMVSVGSANVRSSPNKETNDNVLFTLYQGDTFQVLSYDGYWYQINYNGTICYISHKMVEVW